MGTIWFEHAWLGGERVDSGVLINHEHGFITNVQPGIAAPPGVERIHGLALPGLANAHSHAFHRALRGRTHGNGGTFWTWRDQMYRLAGSLDPDRYLDLATATYAEMALAGITCVGEFHYLHHGPGGTPYDDANEMGVMLVEAARRAGVRMTLIDTCYLHGGIGAELNEVQKRFSDGAAEDWAARALLARDLEGPTVRSGAAIHSVRAVDPLAMHHVAMVGNRLGVLHAHVSEQPAENEDCLRAYGKTPVALLDDADALGSTFTAVHATHLTPSDVALLGASKSRVCLCPTTERDLGDGIGRAKDLLKHKARLAVGSDSHAVIDILEDTRAVELDERLAFLERGRIAASELLCAATRHGHESLGWADAGLLAVGAVADVSVVGLDSVRLADATTDDLVPAVVYAATAADVRHVMVDGRWIVRDGRHVLLDDVPGALRSSIQKAWAGAPK